jgi:hypothetical protein
MKKERCEKKVGKNANSKKIFALSQICSLVLEIIAFSFLFSLGLGLGVGGVSASENYLTIGDLTGPILGGDTYKVVAIDEAAGQVTLYNPEKDFTEIASIAELKENYNLEFASTEASTQAPSLTPAVTGARATEKATGGDNLLGAIKLGESQVTDAQNQWYSISEGNKLVKDNMGNYKYDVTRGQYYDPETGERLNLNDKGVVISTDTGPIDTATGKGFFSFLESEVPANWGKSREFDTLFGKVNVAPMWGHLLQGVQWATVVLGATQLIGNFLPQKSQSLVKSLGLAISAGIMTFKLGKGGFETFASRQGSWGSRYGNAVSAGAALLVAYYVFASQYEKKDEKEQKIEFKCMAWQAPRGGADCDKCNGNPLKPCSEYRCRALGQTCKLINAGTGKERCIDGSIDDVTSPGIKPDTTILTQSYSYSDVKIRPPGGAGTAGMRIVSEEGGCLKAFTPFTFGIITTDNGNNGIITQPAQCKIDMNHTTKFDEMQYYMAEENAFVENHSETISLPGTELLNRQFPEIKNDGEYTMYIRCKDGNGNENRDEFAVRFCIDKTPDLTAPVIKATSIPSNSPVIYQVDNLTLGVYTNEPANCRWSRKDADYSNMENNMTCNNAVWEMNAEMLYTCQAKLTAIQDKQDNQFYFRCKDLSENQMQQSYTYNLMGTQPLTILKVGPNGTIGGSTSTIVTNLEVQTDNGFKNGDSECYYSTSNDTGYIKFFETGSNLHKQPLDLTNGPYTYYFKCIDAGGNTGYSSTSFTIFVDKYAPVVARAYSLENKLVVITEENSSCSYSTSSCNFDLSKKEGVDMPYSNSVNHYAEWKTTQTYYIKCSDKYGNTPNPNECSITIRPYELKSN